MSDFFLPYRLSPQGWLTDVLLGQIYGDDSLYNFILADRGHYKKKIISLHPKHKNDFEHAYAVGSNAPSKNKIADAKSREKYIDFIMNITPAQIAALQPYIRLYLKSTDKEKPTKDDWHVRDIIFKDHTDLNFILNNKFSRMGSAGITDVSVLRRYPNFALGNDIEVNISYYFSSMAAFSKGHPVDQTRNMTSGDYLELIKPDSLKFFIISIVIKSNAAKGSSIKSICGLLTRAIEIQSRFF